MANAITRSVQVVNLSSIKTYVIINYGPFMKLINFVFFVSPKKKGGNSAKNVALRFVLIASH